MSFNQSAIGADKDGVVIDGGEEILLRPVAETQVPEVIETKEQFQAVMDQIRANFTGGMVDFVTHPHVRATKKALYAGMERKSADSLLSDYFSEKFRN